jgi:uncharacterized membrane protein
MDMSDVLEWLKAVVRWTHVFAAILWIGQTYLFNWFEKSLERDADTADNVVGTLWMVHGGGFYLVEKQKSPRIMPRVLHWFKWEAATTWLSGVALLVLTYYVDPGVGWGLRQGGLLVEPEMSFATGALAGLGVVLLGWVVYDLLVRSPLGKSPVVFAVVALVAMVAIAFGLRRVMSSRAVYIHVAAMIGTVMAANVWMRILPAQRKMLAAAKEGRPIDRALAATGPLRSKQNSYMAIPMVFLMISNHYPTISYGSDYSALLLGAVILVGWGMVRIIRGKPRVEAPAAQAAP